MSTNFAKTLVWKQDYDVKLWRHKQRTTNTNDYPMSLNETPPWKFCAYATVCHRLVVSANVRDSWSCYRLLVLLTNCYVANSPKCRFFTKQSLKPLLFGFFVWQPTILAFRRALTSYKLLLERFLNFNSKVICFDQVASFILNLMLRFIEFRFSRLTIRTAFQRMTSSFPPSSSPTENKPKTEIRRNLGLTGRFYWKSVGVHWEVLAKPRSVSIIMVTYTQQVRSHGIRGQCPPHFGASQILLCPERFVLNMW